jgi:hypothetical protein
VRELSSWESALQAALTETNPQRRETKIADAEAAIFDRIQSFSPGRDDSEVRNLFEALLCLRILAARVGASVPPQPLSS